MSTTPVQPGEALSVLCNLKNNPAAEENTSISLTAGEILIRET